MSLIHFHITIILLFLVLVYLFYNLFQLKLFAQKIRNVIKKIYNIFEY